MKYFRHFFITALSSIALIAPLAQAAASNVYFDSTFDYTFTRNDINREFGPVLIIDRDGDTIKKEFGIRLIIPSNLFALWEPLDGQLQLSGNAVTQGKMNAQVTPVLSDNLKEVYIPVLADFAKDSEVTISGLRLRTYRIANDKRFIELDVTGDKVGDVNNVRSVSISSTEIRTDLTAPYAITNAAAARVATGVQLTWRNPPDLDLDRTMITRRVTKDGRVVETSFEVYAPEATFIDTAYTQGEVVTYTLAPRDLLGNVGSAATVTFPAPVATPPPVNETPTEPVVTPETPDTASDDTPVGRITALVKERGTYMGAFGEAQLKKALYSSFAAQLVMSFEEKGCAGRSRVLGQRCLSSAKKLGLLRMATVKKLSKKDFLDMLLKYYAKREIGEVRSYTPSADLMCAHVTAAKLAAGYTTYMNAVQAGLIENEQFSCDIFGPITREKAIQIADLFFVKHIR